MLTMIEMAKILETEAKFFRESKLAKKFLKARAGNIINENIAQELGILFYAFCFKQSKSGNAERLQEARHRLWKKMRAWAPNALASIQCNDDIYQTHGKTTLDQDTLDALLVDYINHTYLPAELGLDVDHIR